MATATPKDKVSLGNAIRSILTAKDLSFIPKLFGVLFVIVVFYLLNHNRKFLEQYIEAAYRPLSDVDEQVLSIVNAIPLTEWAWGSDGIRQGYIATSNKGKPVMITLSHGFLGDLPGLDRPQDYVHTTKYSLVIDHEEYVPEHNWLAFSTKLMCTFRELENLDGVQRSKPKLTAHIIEGDDGSSETTQRRFLDKL